MKILSITFKNILFIAFFIIYGYLSFPFLASLSYKLQLTLNLAAMIILYLMILPDWLKLLPTQRKRLVHVITGISFLVALVWSIQYFYIHDGQGYINLFIFVIVFATLFFSIKYGVVLSLVAFFSNLFINVLISGWDYEMLSKELLQLIAFILLALLIGKVIQFRDRITSKQGFLIHKSNAYILGMSRKGKLDLLNPRMAQFLEVESSQVVGRYAWEVLALIEDKSKHQIVNLLLNDSNEGQDQEIVLNTSQGQFVFISEQYYFENDGFINGKAIVLTDITERKIMEKKLEELATTDSLTSLYNKRFFELRLKEELYRSERYCHDAALMVIDADHFKSVNDNYGHVFGDVVLKTLAKVIQENIRNTDVSARIGGEEFAILLPETKMDEAYAIGERIRSHMEHTKIMLQDESNRTVQITISIGISSFYTGSSPVKLMEDADKALYQAKDLGRNRIETHEYQGNNIQLK